MRGVRIARLNELNILETSCLCYLIVNSRWKLHTSSANVYYQIPDLAVEVSLVLLVSVFSIRAIS